MRSQRPTARDDAGPADSVAAHGARGNESIGDGPAWLMDPAASGRGIPPWLPSDVASDNLTNTAHMHGWHDPGGLYGPTLLWVRKAVSLLADQSVVNLLLLVCPGMGLLPKTIAEEQEEG